MLAGVYEHSSHSEICSQSSNNTQRLTNFIQRVYGMPVVSVILFLIYSFCIFSFIIECSKRSFVCADKRKSVVLQVSACGLDSHHLARESAAAYGARAESRERNPRDDNG